jgi:hypothetical protein
MSSTASWSYNKPCTIWRKGRAVMTSGAILSTHTNRLKTIMCDDRRPVGKARLHR